LIYTETR